MELKKKKKNPPLRNNRKKSFHIKYPLIIFFWKKWQSHSEKNDRIFTYQQQILEKAVHLNTFQENSTLGRIQVIFQILKIDLSSNSEF